MTHFKATLPTWLLALLTAMLLAGCGTHIPEPQTQPDQTPSGLIGSSCQIRACSWNFLGANPIANYSIEGKPIVEVDQSGNVVVSPSYGEEVWRYSLGSWTSLGTPINTRIGGYTKMVLDPSGNPVIAYSPELGPRKYAIEVRAWTGIGWIEYPTVPCTGLVGVESLALNNRGEPVIACLIQQEIDLFKVQVQRWNGNYWEILAPDSRLVGKILDAKIAVDANNQVWLAVSDYSQIKLSRLSNIRNRWQFVGKIDMPYLDDLELNAQGQPMLLVEKYQGRLAVMRWNGRAIVNFGPDVVTDLGYYSWRTSELEIRGDSVVVGYPRYFSSIGLATIVVRFDAASNTWVPFGSYAAYSLLYYNSYDWGLGLKPTGEPVVAYDGFQTFRVKHWSPGFVTP